MLLEYTKDELISNLDVVPFSTLTETLKEFMLSKGIEQIKDSTKKHIRRKLEKAVGDKLIIFPDERGKLLVLSHNPDRQQLAERNQTLRKELAVWRNNTLETNKLSEKVAL